jgi:hypothetical protein
MTADLEKRIAALESVAAIKDLKIHYWRSLDQRHFDEVRACFTPDAVIDMEGIPKCENRESFMNIVTSQGQKAGVYNMHHGHHPRIKLAGDAATGTWESYFHGIDVGARTIIQLSGEYHDTYVRQNGRWLIKSKVVSLGVPDPNAFA